MNWKTKAAIQRAFARMPFGSEAAYYQLQRRFGNLRQPESPLNMLRESVAIFTEIRAAGRPIAGARVLEVGTGHRILMPFAFYLAGSRSIVTLDLFPILKRDLVMESFRETIAKPAEVVDILQPVSEPEATARRLRALKDARTFEELSSIMRLQYLSPADATAAGLPDRSIDFHFSYTVFEHIPGPVLVRILREASRLISPDGLICHHIDLSDHFSHSDSSIGKINFLQYSADQWRKLDNPRFGYQNRLRENDYRKIYEEARQRIVRWETIVDPAALEAIRAGFALAPEYRNADPETLCTVSVRALSRPG